MNLEEALAKGRVSKKKIAGTKVRHVSDPDTILVVFRCEHQTAYAYKEGESGFKRYDTEHLIVGDAPKTYTERTVPTILVGKEDIKKFMRDAPDGTILTVPKGNSGVWKPKGIKYDKLHKFDGRWELFRDDLIDDDCGCTEERHGTAIMSSRKGKAVLTLENFLNPEKIVLDKSAVHDPPIDLKCLAVLMYDNNETGVDGESYCMGMSNDDQAEIAQALLSAKRGDMVAVTFRDLKPRVATFDGKTWVVDGEFIEPAEMVGKTIDLVKG